MRFKYLPLLFIVPLFLMLSGCTKDTSINSSNDLSGTWAVTGISSNIPYDFNHDGYTETDIYGTYSNCQRDIVLTFDTGGYGQSREGCNAPWENLSWQYSNNRLDLYIPSGDIHLDITQYDGNTLRGYDQVQVDGRNYNITYTLSRRY